MMRGVDARALGSSQVSSWFGVGNVVIPSRGSSYVSNQVDLTDTTDQKGVVWWFGTAGDTQGFSTPTSQLSPNQRDSGTGASNAIDRNASTHCAAGFDSANWWWSIDLGADYSLALSGASFQAADVGNLMSSIDVQGSDDNTNWDTLTTMTLTQTYGAWTHSSFTSTSYRYLRILSIPSLIYPRVAEMEFYGTLTIP